MNGVDVTVDAVGDEVCITLVGEVDTANADAVARSLHTAITNRVTVATVDLSGVRYLDSAGLRVLFALAARLPRLQITLRLVAPPGSPARRILDLSGLSTLATVVT